jgi:Outer membrane protein beta-barrel domain
MKGRHVKPGCRSQCRQAAAIVGLVILSAPAAEAQMRPGPALEVAAGWVGFADDAVVSEALIGGAGRLYVTPRLALGPEVAYIDGDQHSHLMVTGNLTFDFLNLVAGQPPKVDPFVVVGGGWFRTRESFAMEPFTSSEGTFTAGGGLRVHVSRRLYLAGEARIGWETHLRVNGAVGFRLGP